MNLAMLATLLCLADALPDPQGPPQTPPPVAVLPEKTRLPKPKVEANNNRRPGATSWPSPHRKFTRKG